MASPPPPVRTTLSSTVALDTGASEPAYEPRAPRHERTAGHCFAAPSRSRSLPHDSAIAFPPDDIGRPLAELLRLLGCGEEAASLAFDGLARGSGDPLAAAALATIASDEQVHDALIRGLLAALPSAPGADVMLSRARRFHIRLAAGGPTLHLARIAALDSAVCIILSRLTCAPGRLSQYPGLRLVLLRIRSDEARHVTISRRLVSRSAARRTVRDAAAAARDGLADTLALARDAIEALAVDPDALLADVRRLPNGLFPA